VGAVPTKRIVILSARVGAGHDGAAAELTRRIRDKGFEVTRHDFLDLLPGRLGQRLCDAYHRQLELAPRSWDWLLSTMDTRGGADLAVRFAKLATPNLLAALDPSIHRLCIRPSTSHRTTSRPRKPVCSVPRTSSSPNPWPHPPSAHPRTRRRSPRHAPSSGSRQAHGLSHRANLQARRRPGLVSVGGGGAGRAPPPPPPTLTTPATSATVALRTPRAKVTSIRRPGTGRVRRRGVRRSAPVP
jgi:hypothetical protein